MFCPPLQCDLGLVSQLPERWFLLFSSYWEYTSGSSGTLAVVCHSGQSGLSWPVPLHTVLAEKTRKRLFFYALLLLCGGECENLKAEGESSFLREMGPPHSWQRSLFYALVHFEAIRDGWHQRAFTWDSPC